MPTASLTTDDTPSTGVPATGASKARRPQARTARRREDILKAATQVFATRGYRNASLNEIADIVGITHAGVLHHFGSKERLLIDVLEYRDDADVEHLEGHHAPQGAEFFRHLVRTAAHNAERPGIVQTYAVLSAESVTDDHPGHAFFSSRYAGLRRMLRDAVHDSFPDGGAPADDEIAHAAAAIIAVMDGLQVQWLLEPAAIDMPASLALTIDALTARWGLPAGVVSSALGERLA